MNSPLFNNKALRQHLLDRAKALQPNRKFTRVSSQAVVDLHAKFLRQCDEYVRAQRIGQTITTP